MARKYLKEFVTEKVQAQRYNVYVAGSAAILAATIICFSPFASSITPSGIFFFGGLIPTIAFFLISTCLANEHWVESERDKESTKRDGKPVLGMPPKRDALSKTLKEMRAAKKVMMDRYLVGFELDSGEPIWVQDDDMCGHAAVFAKTGVGKTLWLEGIMFQQMARGRASGLTFIDAKRDPGTLADIIMMALITGRIEDVVVVDPFDPVCAYNFVFTTQRADVKARKVLRCGLPPTTDQSTTKHYDRLAADAVARVVRAMESLGLAWSVRDVAVALSAFTVAYPRIRNLLHENNATEAMIELGHLASSYRTAKGAIDSTRVTDNLRGIASELHSISNSEAGEMFCAPRADLSLTDAILRGKIVYYMLPRLEEAEGAARMVKVFREDLEVSIGEVTSSREYHLEDPHLVFIDEGASTFGPTWANLFELARKGRFALLFGAQSVGGLMDAQMGLSEQFYERVMANVNLKVIMRVGDNRTAMDMTEWIGKITVEKTSVSTGLTEAKNSRFLTKHIEVNKRESDSIRDALTLAEDEEDLVSAEELKHEMSAEKGLAWFDKGDGRLRKGRAIWFNSEVPDTWEGREFLTRYESVEADEIGLAEWVDEHILVEERDATERQKEAREHGIDPYNLETHHSAPDSGNSSNAEAEQDDQSGGFRLNLFKGFKGMNRSRTFIETKPEEKQQSTVTQHNNPIEPENVDKAPQVNSSELTPPKSEDADKGRNISGDTNNSKGSDRDQLNSKGHKNFKPRHTKHNGGNNTDSGKLKFKGKNRDVVSSSGEK